MTQPTHHKAKVYDRPERKGLPPLVLAIIAVIVLSLASYAGYKILHHEAATRVPTSRSTFYVVPQRNPLRMSAATGRHVIVQPSPSAIRQSG